MSAVAAPPEKRRRRWHRIVIPFAVALALFLVTGVAHALNEPDLGDPGTLAPTGTGPDGSSRLAALLAERGIALETFTNSSDLVRAARAGDATVFVPAANLSHPLLPYVLSTLPVENRLILVEPSARTVGLGGLPFGVLRPRWASRDMAPGCADPVARGAGRATALRTSYGPLNLPVALDIGLTPGIRCYGGGLVSVGVAQLELMLVGASDPFRNGRIDEHGNAELAVGLLATHKRVLWLDLHEAERRSFSVYEGSAPTFDLPDNEGGGGNAGEPEENPLFTVFPPWVWALAVQLIAVVVLLALWRARRLGPPVAEPLPVVVPAAETVTGRGRLYARADARGAALKAVRVAAVTRLSRLLDLPREAAEEDVVAAVAARTGEAGDQVWLVLYGLSPVDDDELLHAVAQVDALTARIAAFTGQKGPS